MMDIDSGPWVCSNADCGKKFCREEVQDFVRLGINYKKPELYAPDKLVIRKTGRGIYATIDRTEALTTQVTFIYKLKPDAGLEPSYLYYVLGVLNSRLMLYKYYKKTGDIEWKSFPYLTQKEIHKLPIYNIDLNTPAELDIYNRISTAVQAVIVRGTPPTEHEDELIEGLVRRLYKLTPEMSARVDSELSKIEQYGALLGNRDAQPDDEDDMFEED
jgi:adenine-specific DNA-methyltransferase